MRRSCELRRFPPKLLRKQSPVMGDSHPISSPSPLQTEYHLSPQSLHNPLDSCALHTGSCAQTMPVRGCQEQDTHDTRQVSVSFFLSMTCICRVIVRPCSICSSGLHDCRVSRSQNFNIHHTHQPTQKRNPRYTPLFHYSSLHNRDCHDKPIPQSSVQHIEIRQSSPQADEVGNPTHFLSILSPSALSVSRCLASASCYRH